MGRIRGRSAFLAVCPCVKLSLPRWLVVSMIAVAVIGAIVTLSLQSAEAAGWTGVAAGLVLLFVAAIGPQMSQKAAVRRV